MVLNHPLATAFHTPSFTLCSHFSTPRVACTSWTSTIRSARLSTRPLYTQTRRGRSTCTTSSSGCGGVHTSAEDWVGAPHMQLRSPPWLSLPAPLLPVTSLHAVRHSLPPSPFCVCHTCLPACLPHTSTTCPPIPSSSLPLQVGSRHVLPACLPHT